jgi:hypothetical protein
MILMVFHDLLLLIKWIDPPESDLMARTVCGVWSAIYFFGRSERTYVASE